MQLLPLLELRRAGVQQYHIIAVLYRRWKTQNQLTSHLDTRTTRHHTWGAFLFCSRFDNRRYKKYSELTLSVCEPESDQLRWYIALVVCVRACV